LEVVVVDCGGSVGLVGSIDPQPSSMLTTLLRVVTAEYVIPKSPTRVCCKHAEEDDEEYAQLFGPVK
jgi:hypothetical protein